MRSSPPAHSLQCAPSGKRTSSHRLGRRPPCLNNPNGGADSSPGLRYSDAPGEAPKKDRGLNGRKRARADPAHVGHPLAALQAALVIETSPGTIGGPQPSKPQRNGAGDCPVKQRGKEGSTQNSALGLVESEDRAHRNDVMNAKHVPHRSAHRLERQNGGS